jgi:hypothetical protein
MLGDLQSLTRTVPIQHRILRQLIFHDIRSRHTTISSAEKGTYDWILARNQDVIDELPTSASSWALVPRVELPPWMTLSFPRQETQNLQTMQASHRFGSLPHKQDGQDPDRMKARRAFLSWLREGRDVLHISGKAGSGKSTLMKFLAEHERTKKELRAWAGGKTLVLTAFYFWGPGANPLQMTFHGLYRTLLFETLSRCPELMEEVFPRQWKLLNAGPGDRIVESMEFGQEDIEQAFDALVKKTKHPKHRFCFFIDGLDEYPGRTIDYENLAQKLKSWTEGEDIKICASSRPYPAFHEIFTYPANPTIHLHLLNRQDIYAYCYAEFKRDRVVSAANDSHGKGYMSLVPKIVNTAQGVFLWAYLVVRILLEGIHHRDELHNLEKKFREIPTELEKLYAELRKMVGRSETDRIRSDKMLLLAAKNPFDQALNALAFSWLDGAGDLEDPSFPCVAYFEPYSEEKIAQKQEFIETQIKGLTLGLLEVDSEGSLEPVPKGSLEPVPKRSLKVRVEEISEYHPEDISEYHPEDISESYPEDISETYPEDISESHPEDISESYPEDISETYPEDISESHPEDISESDSEDKNDSDYDEIEECHPKSGVYSMWNSESEESYENRKTVDNSFFRLRVQFFHRTAQDYLLQRETLKALQDSFPGFEQTDPYGRLRLAEYMLGLRPPKGDPEEKLNEILLSMRNSKVEHSVKTIRGFKVATERLNEIWHWPILRQRSCFRSTEITSKRYYRVHQHAASFIHYAAYSGFKKYVLSEIAADQQLNHVTDNLSILLSAIYGEEWGLVLSLLENGIALDDQICIESHSDDGREEMRKRNRWPLWIIASVLSSIRLMVAINTQSRMSTSPLESPFRRNSTCWGWRDILRRLVQHGDDIKESFSMAFKRTGHVTPTIEIGYFLRFFDDEGQFKRMKAETGSRALWSSMDWSLFDLVVKDAGVHICRVSWRSSYLDTLDSLRIY